LTVRVKRVKATQGPARGQLWLLNGGPGAASGEFEPVMLDLATRDPGLDLYTTDFRGTGDSTRLTCPQDNNLTPDNLDSCLAKIGSFAGDLSPFTTSEGARDVASLVASTREAGQTAVVFGFSYGTFWLHRLLQIYPTLLDGAILDSTATPQADFSTYAVDSSEVAQEFFGRCAADATCAAKLGPDPWAKVQELFAIPDKDFCKAGGDRATWTTSLARLLQKAAFRPLVPALVYRLLRCSPDDKKAITSLVKKLQVMATEPVKANTPLLYDHVVFSDLWTATPQTAEEYDARDAKLLIALGGTGDQQRLWDVWPRTPHDEFAGQTAQTTIPLLLLQGGLDPQTPRKYVDAFSAAFSAPGQHYVVFPDSPHGVAFQTPKASDPTRTCGMDLVLQFAGSPAAALDLSCQSDLAPIDFSDQPAFAQSLLGQPSIWEANGPPPAPLPAPRLPWVPGR
jgi:pimeloyl-ACP methyl ester carboxylesterase